jgi:hypothetical protein
MKWIYRLKDALQVPPSDKEKLKAIVHEHAVSDFLQRNPEFEVKSHHYPFTSCTFVDARGVFESDEDNFMLFLNTDYYDISEWERRYSHWEDKGAKVVTIKYWQLIPQLENPFYKTSKINRKDKSTPKKISSYTKKGEIFSWRRVSEEHFIKTNKRDDDEPSQKIMVIVQPGREGILVGNTKWQADVFIPSHEIQDFWKY